MTTSTGSGTRRDVTVGADLGLLVLRGVVGALFVGHGLGKLFGWFGQPGLDGTAAFFESIGYPGNKGLAVFAGLVELTAGALLLFGVLVPLASAMVIGDMVNAAWFKSAFGFWIADDGYEYEFVLIVVALTLAVTGPGAYSVDKDRSWLRSRIGDVAAAVVLGLLAGVVLRLMRDA